MKKAILSWSGGKDSAWALERLRHGSFEVIALLTTVDEATGRVPIHGIPGDLLELQAASIGIPLWTVPLPSPCSNTEYCARLSTGYAKAISHGATTIIFGDLFLADIRQFREASLRETGLEPEFPLWGLPTAQLAREMVAGGLRAVISSVDLQQLSGDYAGRLFDPAALPPEIDPCGENGEFHTFVTGGPMFAKPVCASVAGTRQEGRFAFAELRACPESSL